MKQQEFLQKKCLEPDESIDKIHTLITAFRGATVNVGGITIHSAFCISPNHQGCDEDKSGGRGRVEEK
jgi:hypothetical protein